jgi:hypothetical protein
MHLFLFFSVSDGRTALLQNTIIFYERDIKNYFNPFYYSSVVLICLQFRPEKFLYFEESPFIL